MIHYFILFILINIAFTLPRFSVENGASCIACHVNPTGSGLRNSYGNDIVSLEELPFEKWINKGDQNWNGKIGKHLQIGGDFRLQGIEYNATDTTRKIALFPMQADIYFFLNLNQNASIYSMIGARGRNSFATEYWLFINNLPQNLWLKIGKALPNYGLRIDDHTSFIRGGNYNRTTLGLQKEGLLFDPYLTSPSIMEIGVPMLGGFLWTSSISTGISTINESLTNFTTQFNYTKYVNENIKYMYGLSYMKENHFEMMGLSGGISIAKLTYTFEVDQVSNWINGYTSLAIYDQLSCKITQGLHIIGKYDYFDPQTEILSGSVSRFSIGAEIYPLNIMEIKLQARINQIDNQFIITKKPEYLIQTHFWF